MTVQGLNVIIVPESYLLGEPIKYVQVRVHHKKRINKKWRKKYGFKPVYKDLCPIIMDNNIYVTEKMYQNLINEMMPMVWQNPSLNNGYMADALKSLEGWSRPQSFKE